MIRSTQRLFPTGLYATLAVAACCMLVPSGPRRLQGWLAVASTAPARVWAAVAQNAHAAAGMPAIDAAQASLRRRLTDAAIASGTQWRAPGFQPVPCRVVDRGARGHGGLPATLTLDRPRRSLADCEPWVSSGDALVGFLAPAGDDPTAAATVQLLWGRPRGGAPRRVPAVADAAGAELAFVVEPAGEIDPWPLRCRTVRDPYLLSQLRHGGQPVRTAALPEDPLGWLPPGMQLGRLQLWGYPGLGAIDVFVDPAVNAAALSMVVVWRPGPAQPAPLADAAPVTVPVRRLSLPSPLGKDSRWLLLATGERHVRAGAAVLAGDWLAGIVDGAGRGTATATPLAFCRRPFAATLLPDAVAAQPVDLVVRVLAIETETASGFHVRIERVSGGGALQPGLLFTAANGLAFPPGRAVGRVTGTPDRWWLAAPRPPAAALRVVCATGGEG